MFLIELLGYISSWASIVGLILSVILIFITSSVESKIKHILTNENETKEYNSIRKNMKTNFESYQTLILQDKIDSRLLLVKISNELDRFQINNSLLNRKDKKKIRRLTSELEKANLDKIAFLLGYFISRCDKKEVFWYGR